MTHSDKMAYFMINLCRMLCLGFMLLSVSAYSQTFVMPRTKMQQWQSKPVVSYKAAVTERLDQISARTGSGYYAKRYQAQESPTDADIFTLRTLATCDVVCISAALPVTLMTFVGQRVNALQTLLNWETSSETNNAGFEIERSPTTTDFKKVGFVDGSGNSAGSKKYQFSDRNSSEEVTYYRLKQLDHDGSFEYSRMIAVQGFRELLSLVTVPNPGSQNNTFLQVKGNSGEIDLTIFNAKGVVMYRKSRLKLATNKQISLAELPRLTTGLYVAKITSADQQSTVSFVIAD